MGGAYPISKNPDQIVNVRIMGHASAENKRLLEEPGGVVTQKNFEI